MPFLTPALSRPAHPSPSNKFDSTTLLNTYLSNANIPPINLQTTQSTGFTRAQGTAGLLLERMDHILKSMPSNTTPHSFSTP